MKPPNDRTRRRCCRSASRRCPRSISRSFILRFYVDDSLEGIAAALGCSVGTVKSRLFHALDKLRAMHALREQREPGQQMFEVL